MGTSKSEGSPATTAWNAVRAAYGSAETPADRLIALIWRADGRAEGGGLETLLSGRTLLQCLGKIATSGSPEVTTEEVARICAATDEASIATDLARRAAVHAASQEQRQAGFIVALFDEATNYLVSRDLPGLIGSAERLASITQGRLRKSQAREITRGVTSEVVAEVGIPDNPRGWRALVSAVAHRLRHDY